MQNFNIRGLSFFIGRIICALSTIQSCLGEILHVQFTNVVFGSRLLWPLMLKNPLGQLLLSTLRVKETKIQRAQNGFVLQQDATCNVNQGLALLTLPVFFLRKKKTLSPTGSLFSTFLLFLRPFYDAILMIAVPVFVF